MGNWKQRQNDSNGASSVKKRKKKLADILLLYHIEWPSDLKSKHLKNNFFPIICLHIFQVPQDGYIFSKY